ncbi:hypothetical protein BZY94_06410 [Burkholderia territorii]|nr:hypothetical protein BZY94_06410 [Burkholderia territorii]
MLHALDSQAAIFPILLMVFQMTLFWLRKSMNGSWINLNRNGLDVRCAAHVSAMANPMNLESYAIFRQ